MRARGYPTLVKDISAQEKFEIEIEIEFFVSLQCTHLIERLKPDLPMPVVSAHWSESLTMFNWQDIKCSFLSSRKTPVFLVSVAITIVVLLATWVPTRRAVALPPREALWRE